MTIKNLSRKEALDLVIGAKILACGGGGSDAKAIDKINEIYDREEFFTIADLSDFQEEDSICIIGMVGGGITKEDRKLVEGLEIVEHEPMIKAVETLERFLNISFQGFVATELGPYNSIVPLIVASQMGKIAVDGDCCGRSKPMISISTTAVMGISISPYSIVNSYGDIQIVESAVDDIRGEVIARTAARLSGGSVSVARCPMTINQANTAVIPKTFSKAIELGKKVRETAKMRMNPIRVILETIPEIKVVFRGKVTKFSRKEEGGFTSGEILLESENKVNDKLKIFYQNEYLLSWLNDKQYISCPDGIIVVDSQTGYGLTPWEDDFTEGRAVTVLAQEAPEIWKTERGLDVFGPQNFDKTWSKYKKKQ
ncbi:MAG: DUF917 domain-containing protein [Candidatus Heimdallarchaeota archaeon]|nr:DUF917 domain-containing protein [Candidatus Heimdallarchaeota archaeon]MCK4768808.1 DUF917 domain-containing protein [Candidatus Heimdallarchaeota archaeon]